MNRTRLKQFLRLAKRHGGRARPGQPDPRCRALVFDGSPTLSPKNQCSRFVLEAESLGFAMGQSLNVCWLS